MDIHGRPERVAAVITLTELGYPQPDWADAIALVETLNRDAALVVLCQFNLFLAISSIQSKGDDLKRGQFAQRSIIANVLSDSRLNEIRQVIGSADVSDRILVHRSFCLACIRLVARFAKPHGGNTLAERDAFDVLGELALIVNCLLSPNSDSKTEADIAAAISPSIELDNHPSIANALVRADQMLGAHLAQQAAAESAPGIASRAEQVFVITSGGLGFQAYRDALFALFAFYSALKLEDILADQKHTYFRPDDPKNVIGPRTLIAFLEAEAVPFEELSFYLGGDPDTGRLLHDFTLFRRRPIWRFADGSFLCVDPAFMMDKLAEGTYWWVMDGFGPEGDTDAAEWRRKFSGLWGQLFESYVGSQLIHAHPQGKTQELRLQPFYEAPEEEAADALILDGKDLVLIQAKGYFLAPEIRYCGIGAKFCSGLDAKFGCGQGAPGRQLLQTLEHLFSIDHDRRQLNDIDLKDVTTVFPVVLVQERQLGFWLTAKLLVEIFEAESAGRLWRLDLKVRPVIYMTIGELEDIVEHIRAGDFSLAELLRTKLGTDRDHLWSLGQYFKHRFLPGQALPSRTNSLMDARWVQLRAEALQRYEDGVYT